MKQSVKIEGLDCANCARALENEINKLDEVKNAKVDFVKSTIYFESDDEKVVDKIVKVTKMVEPDAKIILTQNENKNKKQFFNKQSLIDFVLMFVGLTFGVVALTVTLPTWVFLCLYVTSLLILGYKTYLKALRLLFKGTVNENLLITLSVIGASAIGKYMEGVMVLTLYSIGKIFEAMAVNRSRESIENLLNIKPEFACKLENGQEIKVKPEEIEVGDLFIVKAGQKVAVDGVIESGQGQLDTQSLTGESLPSFVKEHDEILAGSIVLDSVIIVRATKKYDQSTVKTILNLIENASSKKSKTETFISKMTKWYTLAVVLLAVSVWGIVWAVSKNFNIALYRGLIFLVISCPCAFAISVPLSYFSGIGNASKKGILIKGSNYLDACAKLDVIAFDKTGTITTGEFEIERVEVKDKTLSEKDILFIAGIGEKKSSHPLAEAIVKQNENLPGCEDFSEIAGQGVSFVYENKKYFVGRRDLSLVGTAVEVYEGETLLGRIYLSDKIKESALNAITSLNKDNIDTALLSGDNFASVSSVCKTLGIKDFVSKMLPNEKYEWIKTKKEEGKDVGFVGDGINDAPSLMLANVGFSMGIKGSNASIEASDVVIVDDDLNKVSQAIRISKYTRKIVLENIILSAGIKVLFLTLGAFGVTGMLGAVIADVGVTVVAILNSIRALKYNPKNSAK